jgi:hypothetical protein
MAEKAPEGSNKDEVPQEAEAKKEHKKNKKSKSE